MAEPVERWWARRQFSRGVAVPYAIGTYRSAWASFPALIRQYHPELNAGITLTQVPPAAEVLLQWQCEVGHVFVATPTEQRMRPSGERRRSSWCPECLADARGRPIPALRDEARRLREGARAERDRVRAAARAAAAATSGASAGETPRTAALPRSGRRRTRKLCTATPALPVGTPFTSACAPKPASAAEADLRQALTERLHLHLEHTAVRLGRPFFDHVEAWPDLVLSDLRVAIEYDTTGRHGLEHVGQRELSDRRKDRLLREAGWEVIRVRTGRLPELGPYDVVASGPGRRAVAGVIDSLRRIRGDLLVDAYLIG